MVKAKKHFGQNFLIDEDVKHKIIQAMPSQTRQVLEIGPGLGDLTAKLLEKRSVVAFEIDRDLIPRLETRFAQAIERKQFALIEGDIMERWTTASLWDSPYDLVANLPYYIATPIILKALDDPMCQTILVMVQKEVGEKFCAASGSKEFCSLSVLAQTVGEAKLLFDIPPTAFNPPPKVTSAVIKITKNGSSPASDAMKGFLHAAFAQPRKTLAKNLSTRYPKALIEKIMGEANLCATIRPHELTTPLFYKIFAALNH